jgi:hypothetical protein
MVYEEETYFDYGVEDLTVYMPGLPPTPFPGLIEFSEKRDVTPDVKLFNGSIYESSIRYGVPSYNLRAYSVPTAFLNATGEKDLTGVFRTKTNNNTIPISLVYKYLQSNRLGDQQEVLKIIPSALCYKDVDTNTTISDSIDPKEHSYTIVPKTTTLFGETAYSFSIESRMVSEAYFEALKDVLYPDYHVGLLNNSDLENVSGVKIKLDNKGHYDVSSHYYDETEDSYILYDVYHKEINGVLYLSPDIFTPQIG